MSPNIRRNRLVEQLVDVVPKENEIIEFLKRPAPFCRNCIAIITLLLSKAIEHLMTRMLEIRIFQLPECDFLIAETERIPSDPDIPSDLLDRHHIVGIFLAGR